MLLSKNVKILNLSQHLADKISLQTFKSKDFSYI